MEKSMTDYKWEFIYDNSDTLDGYDESMTNGTYIDDEYRDDVDDNVWQNYYEEIGEIIE